MEIRQCPLVVRVPVRMGDGDLEVTTYRCQLRAGHFTPCCVDTGGDRWWTPPAHSMKLPLTGE